MVDLLTRRAVVAGAGASLTIPFAVAFTGAKPGTSGAGSATPAATPGGAALGAYLQVDSANNVTLSIGSSEMGQGIMTGLAQLVAEELMLAWSQVVVVHALASGCAQSSPGFLHMGRVCRHVATCVVYPRGIREIVSWMVFSCQREALRLQRWLRQLLFERRAARRLAIAMALHPRLGACSPLSALCGDSLRAVALT